MESPFKVKLANMDTQHTKEKPFKCELCHMIFSQIDSFNRHKTIHGVRPFKCDFCEKAFCTKGELTVLKRIHTGEKL